MGRIQTYVGPKVQIKPEELSRYDNGKWHAEEKHDGAWALVDTDKNGVVQRLTSRAGKDFSGSAVEGLLGLRTHLRNSKLATELETASQAATIKYSKLGYRRFWVFDALVLLGQSITQAPYHERRLLIEQGVPSKDACVAKRMLVTERRDSGFVDFFNEVRGRGGEGLVLKLKNSLYVPGGADGKTDAWVRAKLPTTVDFYVMGIGKTPSGAENLEIGLWENGKHKRVQAIPVPKGMRARELVGKVVECVGDYQMDSGALRHAHFNRVRNDKCKEMTG